MQNWREKGLSKRKFKKGLVVIVLLTLFSPLENSPPVFDSGVSRVVKLFFSCTHHLLQSAHLLARRVFYRTKNFVDTSGFADTRIGAVKLKSFIHKN